MDRKLARHPELLWEFNVRLWLEVLDRIALLKECGDQISLNQL